MEAVAAAASIVGVLEISLKVLSLTVEYSTQVKSAKEDISRFRLELEAFIQVVRSLHELSQNPEASKLVTFNSIARSGSIQQCELDLKNLQTKLKPSKGERAMSRYGVRALKWPFESKELHNLLVALERYKSTFSTALNADQSYLILESGVKLDLAEQDRCLSKLSYAVGSNFDSNERENEPYCLPDTRVEILSQILEWSADPGHKSIFWLNGMAGTGKSTIARTIARTLTEQKRLAANFFFSRGRGDLSHAGKLLSTIAVQLAATSPTLKRYICEAISENSDVIRQSMRDQWTQLIYKPLSRLEGGSQSPLIIVFVFDALDECGPQDDVRKLIQLLAETKHLVAVQFRALVTSRPEIPIQLGFRAISGKLHEDFVLHNIAPPVVQHDIEIFLRHEINVMRDEHLLPSDWPSKEKFDLLVERCSGLFIYAATVCRFIHDPKWLPMERLDIVLRGSAEQLPEQRLDEMYIQILKSSVFGDCNEKEKEVLSQRFRSTVGSIIILFDSLSNNVLKSLLPSLSTTIDITLKPLKSLLDIPEDQRTPIRILHPSFRDFLINQERCRDRDFWIDQNTAHHDVAQQCLHLMSQSLKRNMCQLETPGTPRSEIDSAILHKFLPSPLQYACQYWVGHLQKGILNTYGISEVYVFLQAHFLHWLEALSLMGKTSETVVLINMLESVPEFQSNSDLFAFIKDAKRFILRFRYIVDRAPLQLYSSALIFSPEQSIVKRNFRNQMPEWLESLLNQKDWTSSLQTLEGHRGIINTLTFSPNGQFLVSGSTDETVKLWNPVTGDLRSTLKGHSDWVRAVAFSPDGQLLASGSDDRTVKLWDPVTGDLRTSCQGHSDYINVVVFSPDSRLLASGSNDCTIRLWDSVTGDLQSIFKGHLCKIKALVFSPDGHLLASASGDSTVGLWNPIIGNLLGVLAGHEDDIMSIVLSPDGQFLVSGSRDATIKLWNPVTGDLRSTLKGHSGWVRAVAFSPDGQLLASGSGDRTVKLWDPVTGDLRSTFQGHSQFVSVVVFSPDSRLLASGSFDRTIRLWDPVTGDSRGILEGHSNYVHNVVFSPNGQLLASGSYDFTLRIWDPFTRDSGSTFEGHSARVQSIVFSPDGQLLASGSDDETVRLWDPATGDSRGKLKGEPSFSNIVFSPDGQLLASVSYWSRETTVELWETATGGLRRRFDHLGQVHKIAFSPDGQLLASGCRDQTVRLWDTVTGDERVVIEGHSEWVATVVFSPDGQLLASGSGDKTVRLWDPFTGHSRGKLEGHSGWVNAIAFSPDGQLLASGSSDMTVRLWDTATGGSRGVLEGSSDEVLTVIFSPDGQLLASGSRKFVRLWLVDKKTLLQQIVHTPISNACLCFSKDGSKLILDGKVVEIPPAFFAASPQKQASTDLLYSIGVEDHWVTWRNRNVLWLPFDHRPFVYAIKNNTLVMGNESGRMTFLSFSTNYFPF